MSRPVLSGLLVAVIVSGFALSATAAEPLHFNLTVSAGKRARNAVPVSVPLSFDAAYENAGVRLTGADGHEIDAQLTLPGLAAEPAAEPAAAEPAAGAALRRELHFILPRLEAGGVAHLRATLSVEPPLTDAPTSFQWTDVSHEHILLTFGSRKVLDYIDLPFDDSTKQLREKTYKVFHQLYDPEGTHLVSKGAGGQDTHHRGLFYGFSRITYGDGKQHANTWQCTGDSYESHEGVLASAAGPVIGRQLLAIDWHGEKKKVFAHEERELTVYAVPGGTLLDFTSRLKSVAGTVHLDGDADNPHHAGFHFRAANEVAAKTHAETYYLRPDAIGKPGKEVSWGSDKPDPHSLNQPWKGMSFVIGGKRYTAAILDTPENPKESRWSERNYGRFGSYFIADVTSEKPLTVRYRFWLQDGETTQDRLAALDADFVEPVTVAVDAK